MKKGFTLTEILGVIVIIALLLLLVIPGIINRLSSSSDTAEEAGNEVVYNSTNQYMNENPNDYPIDRAGKYCIPIKTLVEKGYLVSPVKNIKTGKNIENKTVLVQVLSTANISYNIMSQEECEEELTKPLGELVYTCPSGYTKSGKGSSATCKKTTTTYVSNQSSTYTYCPYGYSSTGLSGSSACKKTTTYKATYVDDYYYCSGTFSYKTVKKGSTNYTQKTATYHVEGTKCVTYYQRITGFVKCTDGKNDGNSCVSCQFSECQDSEYAENGCCSGNKTCTQRYYGNPNHTYTATKNGVYNPTAYCRKVKDASVIAAHYECNGVNNGSSSTCTSVSYSSKNTSTIYYCPNGYTSTGSGSSMICSKTVTDEKAVTEVNNLICPIGYTLKNNKCERN